MTSRLVYTTNSADQTVTIDYHQTLRLFLTDKEQRPFSAERIVQMLNGWAKIDRVAITPVGQLHIQAAQAHCLLTEKAIKTLLHFYQYFPNWQIEYPFAIDVLAYEGRKYNGSSFSKGAGGNALPVCPTSGKN